MAIPPSSFATLGGQLQSETSGLVPTDGNAGFIMDMAEKGALMNYANSMLAAGQSPTEENLIRAATSALAMSSLSGAGAMVGNSAGFGGPGESYSAVSAKLASVRAEAASAAATASAAASAPVKAMPFTGFAVTGS